MSLEKYIAVSGLPGIYELVATRNNGLVIADLDTGKTRFVTMRKHQFTPLGSVAIYTFGDAVEIAVIFKTMEEKALELPIVAPNASPQGLFDYFEKILPEFDRDRVFISDIKKVIKWYNFLSERGRLDFNTSSEEE